MLFLPSVCLLAFIACASATPEGALRLAGSNATNTGRLEIFHEGEWGTVCDDGFTDENARVVCAQLGYSPTAGSFDEDLDYGVGSGYIWMDGVVCTGSESCLTSCAHNGWAEGDCSHYEDITVTCHGEIAAEPSNQEGNIRLVDGDDDYSGRVEIFHEGVWGTVCDDAFGELDAQVVCRQMGMTGGQVRPARTYPSGLGKIWLDDLACDGSEECLGECSTNYDCWDCSDCIHAEDVMVSCQSPDGVITPEPAQTQDGDVRLSGGPSASSGRVEVYADGNWGTVCDDSFSIESARVVCSQLGFDSGEPEVRDSAYFGPGDGLINLDEVACVGDESNLLECSALEVGIHDCSHSEDVSVICNAEGQPGTEGELRLADGESQSSGRLEIFHDGEWGTICDDIFTDDSASVACKQMGFATGVASSFGAGTGRIWLDGIYCHGSEGSLAECVKECWGCEDCVHAEDIGVICAVY